MRLSALLLALLLALPAAAADYAREKKWADEILPAVLVGDPVWLDEPGGHRFLALYTEADQAGAGKARGAVIVVHGIGVHPDWGLVGLLRQRLPEAGYATLSVQMPVLAAEAKGEDYPPTFDEAARRLEAAMAFLKAQGHRKIAIASHSLGCRMSYRYLATRSDSPVAAWVAIGASAVEDTARLRLPILDLYGGNDLAPVLKNAGARAQRLQGKPGSAQVAVPGADHFFEGKDDALLEAVQGFLDRTL